MSREATSNSFQVGMKLASRYSVRVTKPIRFVFPSKASNLSKSIQKANVIGRMQT